MSVPFRGSINVVGNVAFYGNIKNVAADTTIGIDDLGKTVVVNSSTSITVTLPSNVPMGFQFELINAGTGVVTVAPAAGETIIEENGWLRVKSKGKVLILKINANTWFLSGQTKSLISDIYYNNVSLLLNGQGPNNSTIFTDESLNPKTPIATNGTIISTAAFKYGSSSMYFNGGAYLEYGANSDFLIGTNNFTLEFWCCPVSQMRNYPFIVLLGNNWDNSNSDAFYVSDRSPTAPGKFVVRSAAGGIHGISTTTVQNNQWYHVAVVRNGSSIYLFINGVLESTQSINISIGTSQKIFIGGDSNPDYRFNGHLHLRLTKGLARYTASFTPPQDFLL